MVRQINSSSASPAFEPPDDLAQRRLARRGQVEQPEAAAPADAFVPVVKPARPPASPPLPQPASRRAANRAVRQITRTVSAQALRQFKENWRWHFVWIGTMGLFAGTGLGAYLWLAGLPPLPDCQSITPLSPDANRLYCAQEMARSGKLDDLVSGMNLVKDWSPSHPLYHNSQQALAKWSRLVTLAARDKMMDHNDFKGAAEAISKIPASSPAYAEAQKTLSEWQSQWQQGEAISAKAIEAMNQQNWKAAFDQVTELGYLDHDYWRLTQADSLSKQISMQKSSQESLKQAKKLATKLVPYEMGDAIILLQNVSPKTAAWEEAQTLITSWSQDLLKIALQHWQDGDQAGAMQMAAQVPMNLDLAAEAVDLVKLSHAHKLVAENSPESAIIGKLGWRQIWSLMEATTAVQQITPDSPVYVAAQLKLQDWQGQLQDMQQLQIAQMTADLGQKPALEFAIQQAGRIPADRPRSQQAEQLAALWQQQIEQLEDMPYLRLAQQFAAPQTVSALQLAIEQAKVIPSGRAIWLQAQQQVVSWQQQIERLEDQPILDQAQRLAKANKLDEAIGKAAEIRPERALYASAQAAIETWKEKIRAALLAEDQAILDQARNAAGSGDLTGGIAAADQISPGRPLYLEAQSLIGAWLRERDGDPKLPVPETSAPDSSPEAVDLGDSSGGDSGDSSGDNSVDSESPVDSADPLP
ncbi:MAG: hypothetical protein KME07_15865 [Pegethrix bostrychoides GSE-TBD4-15B]|jgi:hypothetical protein|uniref:Chromosome segregation ATPase n=1 Tax=Pegethrix bostrychoides GSE-TBD4-15B TaxID=2839662 RepID=A0A951PC70_9CYAN|nr:hypothetical protein [Pegethrix bostrychoides GSE-TBD4-15B]